MSQEQSIRYGIDLGTTNSSIAILRASRVHVVPSRHDMRITPSAVYFPRKGAEFAEVGTRARQMLPQVGGACVVQAFKKHMGEPAWGFPVPGTALRESACQLSARVLRELVDSLKRDPELPPLDGAVITVPAIFEAGARQDTLRAAEAAGIGYVQLLSEPEAAALAFGHEVGMQGRCTWLVYDLGGGTFDTALVRGEDGVFTKIDTDGDRDLGGSDLDAEVLKELILPALPESLRARALEKVNGAPSAVWHQLMQVAEAAKIEVDIADVAIPSGTIGDIDLDALSLQRGDVERLQVRLFERTLAICRRMLERNRLEPRQIDRLLLVGGPTRSPFLRTMIEKGLAARDGHPPVMGLGIPLETSVDPMTAVAQGAALYAAALRMPMPQRAAASSAAGARVSIDNHTPARVLPDDTDVIVTGRVRVLDGALAVDETWNIRVARQDGRAEQWVSPRPLALKANGAFTFSQRLEPGVNVFLLRVFDASGAQVECDGSACFEVVRAPQSAERTLDHGLGIADQDGQTDWFFPKGHPLPCGPQTKPYSTTVELGPRGRDAIDIPLLQGHEAVAKLNNEMHCFRVPLAAVGRPVPAGARLLVTLSVDRNGLVTMSAELPDFGYSSAVPNIEQGTGVEDIRRKYKLVADNLQLFRGVRNESRTVDALVAQVEETAILEDVQYLLDEGSEQDITPWRKARNLVLEMLKAQEPMLEEVDEMLNWEPVREKCRKNVRIAREIAADLEPLDATWRREFDALCDQFEAAVKRRDRKEAYRLAFSAIPDHWTKEETLAAHVNSGGDNGPTAPGIVTTSRLADKQAPLKRT